MGSLLEVGAYYTEWRGMGGRDMCVLIDCSTSTSSLSASSLQFTVVSTINVSFIL